jgi:hypothetical protein
MALILAIEPDRRQVSKLAVLARSYLHTELVVTDSIGRALAMLDERLPDLILTSFQLQPKHRAALLDRLVEVDADGTRVQTLVIPALGAPGGRAAHQKGMPARTHGMRGNPSVSDGCDPVAFGRQIADCLGRIAAERRSAPVKEWAPPVSSRISGSGPTKTETTVLSEPPAPQRVAASSITAGPEPAPPSRLDKSEWRELLSTIRRDLDHMRAEHAEPSEDTTPTRTPTPAPKVESPRSIRRRTAPASEQAEWAFIKRGFAMLAKANSIAAAGKTPAKKSA